MTLVQLEYIIALDTYRHFALAAEKCFVTQPTLSMQIQKLEDSLGASIFDREKHPVEPTAIGKKIIEQARVILNESQKIKELIDGEKNEVAGKITLGVIPTLAPYLVPLFLSSLLEKYPHLEVTVQEQVSDNLVKMLKRDELDIGLIVTPFKDESLKAIPIFYEEFMAYVSHQHELFKNDILDPSNLQTEGLWILNEGHCFRNQTLDICNMSTSNQFSGRVKYESGSLETLKKLVDKQGGFTLLPELVALDLDQNESQKLRKFMEPIPTREVSLLVKSNYPKQKLVHAIIEEIQNTLPTPIRAKKNVSVIGVRW